MTLSKSHETILGITRHFLEHSNKKLSASDRIFEDERPLTEHLLDALEELEIATGITTEERVTEVQKEAALKGRTAVLA